VKEFVKRDLCGDGRSGGRTASGRRGPLAVSSTNRWVIAEGVRDFGFPEEHILAAEVRVTDG